jgi:hypothetical protein
MRLGGGSFEDMSPVLGGEKGEGYWTTSTPGMRNGSIFAIYTFVVGSRGSHACMHASRLLLLGVLCMSFLTV